MTKEEARVLTKKKVERKMRFLREKLKRKKEIVSLKFESSCFLEERKGILHSKEFNII